jgi:hypothetical protein
MIEQGGRNPPYTIVVDIANARGVRPSDLAEG